MAGIAVLCWEENRPWVSALRQAGLSVPWVEQPKGDTWTQIAELEPEVVVVDLTRQLDQGKDIIVDLVEEIPGVPIVIVSDSPAAERGLKRKVGKLYTSKPKKVVSTVKEALSEASGN